MSGLTQKLKIGELDRIITIRTYTETQSETGDVVATYSDEQSEFCKVEWGMEGNKEKFHADQERAFTGCRFTIRYRADLDKKMKLTFEGATYEVTAISEIPRRRFTVITAELRE